MRFLVVEDEPLIRLSVTNHFEDCGFNVVAASDADRALEVLLDRGEVIDLVFSDVRLPGRFDGVVLARWIRDNRPDLPVLLASGDARKSDVADALCSNQRFYSKPYDLDEVVAHIREDLASKWKGP